MNDPELRTSEPLAWKLISIDGDGTSTLQAYSALGVLQTGDTKITGEELSAKFLPFDKEFKTLVEYPSNEGKYNKEMKADIFADRVKEALMVLAATIIDQPLTVRILPSKAIFANEDVGAGKLRLSPVTKTVYPDSKKKATTDARHHCTLTFPDGSASLYVMSTTTIDKDFCNAFFLVGATNVEDRANMALQSEVVPFIPASATKLKISGNEHIVKIPILVNTSIIKKGDELLYYAPKVERTDAEPKARALQLKTPVSKRPKVTKSITCAGNRDRVS